MTAIRQIALLAAAVAVTSAGAAAQGPAKCNVDEGGPFQLSSANIYLAKAQSASGKADEKPRHLQNGVRVLTENADRIGNPTGRNWLLARLLLEWTKQPSVDSSMIAKRGPLGYTTDPNGTIDLVAAIDTSLRVVQAANPGCQAEIAGYRKNLWSRLYNAALARHNAQQDSAAKALLARAIAVDPENANSYNVLAIIAQGQNDSTGVLANYQKTLDYSATDTSYAKIRKGALYNVALLTLNQSIRATGPEKQQLAGKAVELFRTYARENPSDPNAQTGLSRALQVTGDTAALASMNAQMLSDPSKYTDRQLIESGVAALSEKRTDDAIKLLEAGLQANPYDRDALYNLANAYFIKGDADKMFPLAQRLLDVDPGNPDNYKLVAAAFQTRGKTIGKTPKEEKARRANNDSILKYIERADKATAKLTVTEFNHAGANHSIGGLIENRGTTSATYKLSFDFLDKSGKALATQQVVVGPVASNQSKDFKVAVTQPGIVAYRYSVSQ